MQWTTMRLRQDGQLRTWEIHPGDDDIGDGDVVVDDELEGIDAQLESYEVDMEHEIRGEILT
jgi:hypothetical protein